MPDGDKIHAKLRFFYQNAYKQLCETPFNAENVARELLRSIRKSVEYDGGGKPFRMLEAAAPRLESLPQESLARQLVDWAGEAYALEQLAKATQCKKRVVELALTTAKQVLHDLRNGVPTPQGIVQELHGNYLTNLYQSEFEGKIPLAEHYNGVSQQTVNERLGAIRPFVVEGLEKFAEQIKRRGDAAALRLPKREAAVSPILLHETNLLGGF